GITQVTETKDQQPPETVALHIEQGRRGLRHLASGWTFEPHGMLKETIETVNGYPINAQCKVVNRFQYVRPNSISLQFQAKGFGLPGGSNLRAEVPWPPNSCSVPAPPSCRATTEFWSNDGQVLLDASSRTAPRLVFPDGSVETVRGNGSYIPFNPGLFEFSN